MLVQLPTHAISAKSIPPQTASALITGFILTLVSAVVAGIASRIAQPELPLWYSAPRAAATLAQREWILVLPILCLGLEILLIICLLLWSKLDGIIMRLFAWTTVFAQALLLLALLRIVYITS